MALTVDLKTENIDRNGIFKFTDQTSDYGGTNPARADVGLILIMVKKSTTTDSYVKPNKYDATSASEFFVETDSDFYSKTYLIAVERNDNPDVANYSEGDIVFVRDTTKSPYNGQLREVIDGVFADIPSEELLQGANLSVLQYDAVSEFPLVFTKRNLSNIQADLMDAELRIEDHNTRKLEKKWAVTDMTIGLSTTKFCSGYPMEAQRQLELYQKMNKRS